jgi:hypothetical protein
MYSVDIQLDLMVVPTAKLKKEDTRTASTHIREVETSQPTGGTKSSSGPEGIRFVPMCLCFNSRTVSMSMTPLDFPKKRLWSKESLSKLSANRISSKPLSRASGGVFAIV